MIQAGRNDPCPCGNGKKFKYCYMEENSGCKKQLLEKHSLKDKEVFLFFREVTEDIGSAFVLEKETGNDYVAQRVQLIVVFTFIDTMANYWFEYLGRKDGTPKIRFNDWCNAYCFNNKNHEYKGDFLKINAENLYNLRSSLVHFFGLGERDTSFALMIAPNKAKDEEIDKWRKGFKKIGHDGVFIKPKQLHNFVTEGGLLMLDDMRSNIEGSGIDENKKWQHINGIDRIYKKIMLEGAARIQLPQEK